MLSKVCRPALFFICLYAVKPALSADLPGGPSVTIVQEASGAYYFGGSANFVAGDLNRSGSSFFKVWKQKGENFQRLDDGFAKFSGESGFAGFEAEAYAGINESPSYALEVVAGGGEIWSGVSGAAPKYGGSYNTTGNLMTLPSPVPNGPGAKTTTFQWYSTNQFDIGNLRYKDSFERSDYFAGLRPTFLSGNGTGGLKDGGSLKDPAGDLAPPFKLQPIAFVTGGHIGTAQHFSGATDGDTGLKELNIQFGYDNKISDDFYGVGFGIGGSAPLLRAGPVPAAIFGSVKGAVEFHDATGSSAFTYGQYLAYSQALNAPNSALSIVGCQGGAPAGSCNTWIHNQNVNSPASSFKSVSDSETGYSVTAELGLAFTLRPGIDLTAGGRYRRYDVPQIVLDGVHDARMEFQGANDIGGFAGLKAQF